MSPNTKTVWAVVAVIVIAGGLYFWYTQSQSAATSDAANSATTGTSATVTPGQTGTAAAPNTPATPSSDRSNAALVKDSAALDTQLSALASDNASMNASDQAGPQSY